MDDELDQVLTAIGPRLRAVRQERDTTLAELSAVTGRVRHPDPALVRPGWS